MRNLLLAILVLSSSLVFAQKEQGTYINYFNHYYKDSIMADTQKQESKGRSQFKMEASSVKHPVHLKVLQRHGATHLYHKGTLVLVGVFPLTHFLKLKSTV